MMSDSPSTPINRLPNATGGIARLAFARAREAGLELNSLLKRSGLTLQEIEDRDARLKVPKQIKLLALVAAALPDDFLGFHLSLNFEFRELGLLHYTMASSATLGEALQRAARYSAIVNEGIALRCLEADDLTIACEYVGVARHSDRHQIEFWIAAIIRSCRELTGRRLTPRRVQFLHHRRDDCVEISAFVGTGIEFGAERDAIVLARAAAEMPVIGADCYLNDLLVGYCEEALAQRPAPAGALRSAVENAVAPLLPHGKAELDEIARKLGMSRRTLSRRLASERLSFSGVVDQLRAELARRHVKDPLLSISQIAWLLGYQEVSAFTHAFKRWTGATPTMMRARDNVERT